jgi:hypothetical protein
MRIHAAKSARVRNKAHIVRSIRALDAVRLYFLEQSWSIFREILRRAHGNLQDHNKFLEYLVAIIIIIIDPV